MTDLAQRLRDTLTVVAASTDVSYPPTVSMLEPTRPVRRLRAGRRMVLTVVGALLAAAGGLGVAEAAGVLPDGLLQAFPDDHGGVDPEIDPTTAVRVVSAPGPDGSLFVVWAAEWRRGGQCVAMLMEPAAAAGTPTKPSRAAYTRNGGGCSPFESPSFSASGGSLGEYTTFAFDLQGRVVRAEVQLQDGTSVPAAVQHGWVAGWFTSPGATEGDFHAAANALLVGYGSDGRVVLRTHVQPGS